MFTLKDIILLGNQLKNQYFLLNAFKELKHFRRTFKNQHFFKELIILGVYLKNQFFICSLKRKYYYFIMILNFLKNNILKIKLEKTIFLIINFNKNDYFYYIFNKKNI